MLILVFFAFLAGIVTILSPCILPVLPIVLSGSIADEDDKYRPYGIVLGFIVSFTFFTLFLSIIVKALGIPSDILRSTAIFILLVFGLTMIVPRLSAFFENLFSSLSNKAPDASQKSGLFGGLILGLTLGLLWTPCVGPILASVLSLAIIGEVSLSAVFITAAYAIGTAIPMFYIIVGGKKALSKSPWLTDNLGKIQKGFGVLMILTAIMIAFNYDRKIQTYILTTFPSYGTGLTKIEQLDIVEERLNLLNDNMPEDSKNTTFDDARGALPKLKEAPELIPGGEWINSEPLTLEELRGKVVLIDFWTYSCINCQRTFPYLRAWHEKYSDEGLVIIGVHSPEFEFEKELDNVIDASEDFNLNYPIVQDNEFKTWRAYNNRYWPAKYLIGKDGYIRYTHFGEGDYDETEMAIQTLLKEAGLKENVEEVSNATYENYSRTRETYLGYRRINNFASNENIVEDEFSTYTIPNAIPNNHIAYEGEWIVTEEYAKSKEGAVLYLNFEAKNVFLVMNPDAEESRVRITVQGAENYYGEDVSEDGVVTITEDALYELVDLEQPGRYLLKIEFLDDNTEVYAFTFG